MKKYFLNLKSIAAVFVCLFSILNVYAQETGKPSVYIDYFTRSTSVPFVWVEGLRNHVIEGIQNMDRVILTDVDSQDALRIEKERRESGELSSGEDNDMERVAAMSQLGANYIIQGFVS